MATQFGSNPFGSIPKQIDTVIDEMLGKSFTRFCPISAWVPSVNVYENETSFVVCVDLSGMKKADFNLAAQSNTLVLRGKRPRPLPADGGSEARVHVMEINSGEFCREVEIPSSVKQDSISATYRDGLLWITLPKAEES